MAVTWLGFDQPTSLGDRETGGGAALPIWINFMSKALKGVPSSPAPKMPAGLSKIGENFYFEEFPMNKAIASIGLNGGNLLMGSDSNNGSVQNGIFNPDSTRPIAPTKGNNDAIGDLIQSFNPTSGPPIRF